MSNAEGRKHNDAREGAANLLGEALCALAPQARLAGPPCRLSFCSRAPFSISILSSSSATMSMAMPLGAWAPHTVAKVGSRPAPAHQQHQRAVGAQQRRRARPSQPLVARRRCRRRPAAAAAAVAASGFRAALGTAHVPSAGWEAPGRRAPLLEAAGCATAAWLLLWGCWGSECVLKSLPYPAADAPARRVAAARGGKARATRALLRSVFGARAGAGESPASLGALRQRPVARPPPPG